MCYFADDGAGLIQAAARAPPGRGRALPDFGGCGLGGVKHIGVAGGVADDIVAGIMSCRPRVADACCKPTGKMAALSRVSACGLPARVALFTLDR